MATTSPDNIRTPNPSDPYNLVTDLGVLANDTQAALTRRANLYVGAAAERTALTTAPEGVHWQDTDGPKGLWVRQSGAWVGGDTGWVNVPLRSGFSGQSGQPVQIRRIGKLVKLRWGVSSAGLTAGAATTVADVPVGFRPSNSIHYFQVASNTAANSGRLEVRTGGEIAVAPGPTLGSYFMFDTANWFVA